jgi:N4-gp56 family major capsid protein
MASGTTGTAERVNSLQELLSTDMQFEAARMQVWGQFPKVPTDGAVGGADSGQTVALRFQKRLPLNTERIDEKADIVPRQVFDNRVDVTIHEYGDAIQTAKFAELVTKGDLRSDVARVSAEQMVASLDRMAGRFYYEDNQAVFRAAGAAARVNMAAATHALDHANVGMSFLSRAIAILCGAQVSGFRRDSDGQSYYAMVVYTAMAQDIPFISNFLPALQNREGSDWLFNGEMGEVGGLRFTESEQGKVYPGAGTAAQGATTLSAAVSAGDTAVTVADATGLAVGDIITIGPIESAVDSVEGTATENVLITAVAGTTLTIAGLGYETQNIAGGGLRYDHDAGTSVVEAALIAAIPVFGPDSVMKAYASEIGPFGKAVVSGPFDTLQRFVNVGWYAVQGWNKTVRLWTVRLEVATKFPHLVINE